MKKETREFVIGALPRANIRGYEQSCEHLDLKNRLESGAAEEGFSLQDLKRMRAAIESVAVLGEFAQNLKDACEDLDATIKARLK